MKSHLGAVVIATALVMVAEPSLCRASTHEEFRRVFFNLGELSMRMQWLPRTRAFLTVIALCALMFGSSQAFATTLTFDSFPSDTVYFDSGYSEQGYRFDMTLGYWGSQLHVGDGTGVPGTLNWHDGAANGDGTYMTLTREGGGMFSLLGLHVDNAVFVDAVPSSGGPYHAELVGTGDYSSLNFNDVTSVKFSGGWHGGNYYWASGIDNVVVQAASVPEIDPAGMGSVLALVGGSLGVLERRRRRSA